jgi:hypothetical protein
MGAVVAVQGPTLFVSSPEGLLTVALGSGAEVWKKTTQRDFSDIAVGDEVVVGGRLDASGTLVADQVWANITSFYGMIVSASGNEYQVLLERPESNGERKTVIVDSNVVNAYDKPLPPTDIQVGRFVQTIGMDRVDGRVEATRVIVYREDGFPMGTGPHPFIIDPTGRVIQK